MGVGRPVWSFGLCCDTHYVSLPSENNIGQKALLESKCAPIVPSRIYMSFTTLLSAKRPDEGCAVSRACRASSSDSYHEKNVLPDLHEEAKPMAQSTPTTRMIFIQAGRRGLGSPAK